MKNMYFHYIIFSYIIQLAFKRRRKGGKCMNEYLLNLYKQFSDVRGINYNIFNLKKYESEFIEWVVQNNQLTATFRKFLLSLGYFEGKSISEIGKGLYDSLLLSNAQIISPYANTMNLPNYRFYLVGNIPFIQDNGIIYSPNTNIIHTHNPYKETEVSNWFRIHNSGLYDISIGMYGDIHDRNFSSRLELIEKIAERMIDDYDFNYDTNRDNYFCLLNSKRKVKSKIKKI